MNLLSKRVIDLAGITAPSVKVYLNGTKVKVDNFKQYCEMYLSTAHSATTFRCFDHNAKWDACISVAPGGIGRQDFTQVSFVNSICTVKGGTHVELVASILIDKIIEEIKKKHKNLEVSRKQVKQSLWVFFTAQIENPAFDSQTKETLTSHPRTFGFNLTLAPEVIKKVIQSPII